MVAVLETRGTGRDASQPWASRQACLGSADTPGCSSKEGAAAHVDVFPKASPL